MLRSVAAPTDREVKALYCEGAKQEILESEAAQDWTSVLLNLVMTAVTSV